MIAWVTGGGTGIGRAIAERLVRQGAKVIITGRRPEVLKATAQELSSHPGSGEILAIPGDASNPAHAHEVVAQAGRKWGAIDLLVNNAGANPVRSVFDTTFEEYQKSFEINCLSAINCTLAVLPAMRAAGRGNIVNISSIYGRWAASSSAGYSVSKHAVAGFTDALRQGLIGTDLHVLGVYPGFIRTDMTLPHVVPGSLRSRMGKTPDQLAVAILKAMDRKSPNLYFPWYVPWVLRLHRWFPETADRLARRIKR